MHRNSTYIEFIKSSQLLNEEETHPKLPFSLSGKKTFTWQKQTSNKNQSKQKTPNNNNPKFLFSPQDLHIKSIAAHTQKTCPAHWKSDMQCKNVQIRLSCTKGVNKTFLHMRTTW